MKQIDDRARLNQFDDLITPNVNGAAAGVPKQRRRTIGVPATSHALRDTSAGEYKEQLHWSKMAQRLQNIEQKSRRLKYSLLIIVPLLLYVFVGQVFTELLVSRESLVTVDRMQLFDKQGNVRMFMRVYSGAPVVQLIDESGTPRLSLGLRYDDSPFINLSDVRGQTRAALQVGANDQPEFKLFDENGNASFIAN
jgi:hypothetical protein